MKRCILIIVSILSAYTLNAQKMQEVIASAGGYNVNAGVSLSWTLGETVITTLKSQDGSVILTHGFQQKLIITAIEESIFEKVKIKVFPNPATETVTIQFDTEADGEIIMDVIDSGGKLIKSDLIESAVTNKQVNLQDIPAGIYYLRLTKGKQINVYKVVKL